MRPITGKSKLISLKSLTTLILEVIDPLLTQYSKPIKQHKLNAVVFVIPNKGIDNAFAFVYVCIFLVVAFWGGGEGWIFYVFGNGDIDCFSFFKVTI